MKTYIILINTMLFCLLFSSCKKNEAICANCTETEPAGYMIATKASDSNELPKNQVATLYKTLNNAVAPIGNNWNDPSAAPNRVQAIQPLGWTSDKIGQVFGIALDHNGGIYLSATDVYQFDYLQNFPYNPAIGTATGAGTAGAAGIYSTKFNTINTTTALVTTLNSSNANTVGTSQIPSTGFTPSPSTGFTGSVGNSIGNIAFDYKNNQLFATNLEDGKIYRIDPSNGKVKSTLDPFGSDNGIAGIAPIGEQLWGIGVYTTGGVTKVYFALTTLPHRSNISAPGGVEIWSVALDASGEFNATATGPVGTYTATATSGLIKKEISLTAGIQTKVTDIAFSNTGRMLIAERGNAHAAGVFEYVFNSTWIPGNNFYVGGALGSGAPGNYLSGKNSAGGVDYSDRERAPTFISSDIAWATGNYMPTILLTGLAPGFIGYPHYVYGAQGMSSAGNNPSPSINQRNDLYIDYNCTGWPHIFNLAVGSSDKNKPGDIEFFDQVCKYK